MKVIIQDSASRLYLDRHGRWVGDKDDARDFCSLLNAYHHARENTSVRYRVLLYCPDDQFCSSIIDGVGEFSQRDTIAGDQIQAALGRITRRLGYTGRGVVRIPLKLDGSKNYLN